MFSLSQNFSEMSDAELYNAFLVMYKDVNGFLPLIEWDRQTAVDFCERWSSSDGLARRKTRDTKEDAYFKDLAKRWD